MPISIKDLISSSMRNSPNFTGSPKVGGENIPSIGTDGEVKVNGQAVIVKTREYKMPTCWQNIAEYSLENFKNDLYHNGYGVMLQPYSGASVLYVDPSASTSGSGTLSSPYNAWPTTIPNDAMVLIREYTTLSISSISITASNIIIGTYESDSGSRVIDSSKLATISYNTSTSLFSIPSTGSFTISGVRFVGTVANTNNVVSSSITTVTVNIEYCVFANINSYISGGITGSIIRTSGRTNIRYNNVVNCTTDSFVCLGSNSIYCNKLIYSYTLPIAVTGVKITGGVGCYSDIHHNYISNQINAGQLLSITNNGLHTIIRNNYLFGGKSTEVGSSYCVNSTGTAITNIHHNIVCNSNFGIFSTTASAKIYKNVVCSEYNNYTGITGANVVGNTVVRINGTDGTGIISSGVVANNIIDANYSSNFTKGIQSNLGISQATFNNITGATNSMVDSVGTSIDIASTSNIEVGSYLDYQFRPLSTSPALNSGSTMIAYEMYGNRGAVSSISGVGMAMNLFSPTNGIALLQEVIDEKADLSSPAFVGAVSINGNTPQVTIFKDFSVSSSKTISGVGTSVLGTYSLPNISGNGLIRVTVVFFTSGTGSKTVSVKLNGISIAESISSLTKTSRMELLCSNNIAQNGQTTTTTTDSLTTTTASSVITSGISTFTIVGTGANSSDVITLKSVIVEQI